MIYGASGVHSRRPHRGHLIRPQRMEPKLLVARDWLSKNGNLITAVMLFMIGVVNVGDSLTRL